MLTKLNDDMLAPLEPFAGTIIPDNSTIHQALQLISNYTLNLDSGKEDTIVSGTEAQYLRGDKVWSPLDKDAVGLSNLDNTADLDKPISTATQTALNLKANNVLVSITDDGIMSAGDKIKLNGIAEGATANASDAQLRARSSHTGTQAIATIVNLQSELDSREVTSAKGAINGYAPLGPDGRVPSVNLPENGSYKGNWDASTNTPTVLLGTGTNGDTYTVSQGGTQSVTGVPTDFEVGDQLKYTTNGNKWERIPNTQLVSSVAGLIGPIDAEDLKSALSLSKGDVGLNNVNNTSDTDKPVSTATQVELDKKQSTHANLSAITALAPGANKLMYWTGATGLALADLTSAGRALLDDSDASAQRVTLGLGTSATTNTGTSGATVPFLNGINTWSGTQTFTSTTYISPTGGGSALFYMNSNSGNFAFVGFRTASVDRWRMGKFNDVETGSNVGGDFYLERRDDSGGSLGHVLRITRSSGEITVGGSITPAADNLYGIGNVSRRLASLYTVGLNASNANITGGTITGITDLALADGGTGASTAAGARANLGLGSVDNTSDANKPISLAAQLAFNTIKNGLPLNPLDYCTDEAQRTAVLGGTVGIEIPLNLAIAAAAVNGRSILFPPGGNFKTSVNGVVLNPKAVPVDFNGSTITKVGSGPLFRTGPTSNPALNGPRMTSITLPEGSKTVPLVTGGASSFSPGQWVVISDRGSISGASARRGEIQLIQAVDTVNDTVTFWSPTKYSYLGGEAVGDGYARIIAAPMVFGGGYRNGTIVMDVTQNLPDRASGTFHAFENRWLVGATFSNITIRQFVESGIYLFACVGCRIDVNCLNGGSSTAGDGSGAGTSFEGLPGYSYGVHESGPCMGNNIYVVATNIRHAYSTTGPLTGQNPPIDYGEPYGSVVSGIANFPINAGFDSHEAGNCITFDNIKVNGGHFVGLQLRAGNTTINHLEVNNTLGSALWIRGGTTSLTSKFTVVGKVVARNTNLGVTFDNTDWREYGVVMDEASFTRGGEIVAFNCGGPALMMYRNGGNTGGSWNRITAINPCRYAVTNTYVVNVASSFTNSILINEVHCVSDGKVSHVIYGNGSYGTIRNTVIDSVGHTGQLVSVNGGMAFVNNLDTITGLQEKLNDLTNRIAALEV